MTRYEFIDVLQRALAGNINSSSINDNIRYYQDYIDMKIRSGEEEEAVIESLGDPRLLAKSIIEAGKNEGNREEISYEYKEVYEEGTHGAEEDKGNGRLYRMPGWLLIIIAVVLIVVIIGAVTSLLSALIPILLPVIFIVFIYRLIKNRN